MKNFIIILSFLFSTIVFSQVVTLTDPYTKQAVNFDKISGYVGKIDGVLYAKKDGIIYKRANGGEVRSSWFGVKADGVTDDSQALQNFFNSMQYAGDKIFIVDGNNIKISKNIDIKMKSYQQLKFIAEIKALVGGSFTMKPSENLYNISIENFNISYNGFQSYDTETVGIELSDVANSKISFGRVMGFANGVKISSYLGNGGFSYNTINFGTHHDSYNNVVLTVYDDGYINENSFIGGSFNHSTNYLQEQSTYNLWVDMPYSKMNMINNNKFINNSFEDNSVTANAVYMGGVFNVVQNPRFENPNRELYYGIEFSPNSQYCSVIGSRGLALTAVSDYGVSNSYSAYDGSLQTVSGHFGFVYRNSFSDNVDLISVQDSNQNKTATITGGGFVTANNIYSNNGFFSMTSDGNKKDRGIVWGIGVPTLVMLNGSIYVDTAGAVGNIFYFREGGNWVKK